MMTLSAYAEMEKWESSLQTYLHQLAGADQQAQDAAAEGLAVEIKRLETLLSGDSFSRLMYDLNRRLYEMVHCSDSSERQAAVLAIGRLAEHATNDTADNLARYANYVRALLPGRDIAVIAGAASALSKLVAASAGTLLATELTEQEFERCFEWVSEGEDFGILSAMYVVKDLTESVPSLVFPYISSLLDCAWTALFSSKNGTTRQAASDALRVLLICLRSRTDQKTANDSATAFIQQVLDKLSGGCPVDTIVSGLHGLLLSSRIFYLLSRDKHFEDLCRIALRYAREKDLAIRHEAFALVVQLCLLDPGRFSQTHLSSWSSILMEILGNKREKEHVMALQALKRTIESLGGNCESSLENFSLTIRRLLLNARAQGRIMSFEEGETLDCVAALARALKGGFASSVRTLLPILLEGELNHGLRGALQAIVENVPQSMPLMEDRLLDCFARRLERETDEDSIVFTCESVATFRYWEPVLDTRVGHRLAKLLDHPSTRVRLAAAMGLAHLSRKLPGGEFYESFSSVVRVLTSLMTLATSDPDTSLRSCVLNALNDESLDFYLCSPEPFHLLLMVLGTGPLSCRLSTVSILERITRQNTGLIYPHFRAILLQLLADLSCPHPKSIAEDAAVVLSELARLSHTLVRPTVEPLLRALTPRLLDPNPITATAVLVTMGHLVEINPRAFSLHTLKLVDSVSKILSDQSSSKRRLAALGFLCTLLRNVDRDHVPFERLAELLLENAELLKVELVRPVRNEAIKLIGIIGALDPYRMRIREMAQQLKPNHSHTHSHSHSPSISADAVDSDDATIVDPNEFASTLSPDYYPTVVVSALLKILADESLFRLFVPTVQCLLAVFQSMGVRSSIYLGRVMPALLRLLNVYANDSYVATYTLQALSSMVSIVSIHIRPFAVDIITVVKGCWNISLVGKALYFNSDHFGPEDLAMKAALLTVITSLADALMGENLAELVSLVPLMLSILTMKSLKKATVINVLASCLAALRSMAVYAQDHVHSIIAALYELLSESERGAMAMTDITLVLENMMLLLLELADYADIRLDLPLIVSILNIVLDLDSGVHASAHKLADRVACYLMVNLPEELGPLRRRLPLDKLPCFKIYALRQTPVGNVDVVDELAKDLCGMDMSLARVVNDRINAVTVQPTGKMAMNEQNLRRSWESYECTAREDWFAWMRKFEAELLKESPSASIRACAGLSTKHYPLARDLFNAAFVACWNELPDVLQDELVGSLESALASQSVPPEVMQIILNLAEFMERDGRPLPMDVASLGAYSMKCHAYAKALYYQEIEFQQTPNNDAVEALISVNSQLQQPDSAVGVLVCAQKQHGIVLEESWYEKLQRWDEALAAYREKWERDPQSFDALLGIFRCWHALGDWDALNGLASEVWHEVPDSVQRSLVPLAASAAWSLGDWDKMGEYVDQLPASTPEGSVFRAVLAINKQAYAEAEKHVSLTRELLDTELAAMISESYSRAYNTIVRAQTLSELEEVIMFCRSQSSDDARKREIIRNCWSKRLDDCQVSVEVWQRILKIRSLVMPPEEALARWIKFAALCRRNDRPLISRRILLGLLHVDEKHVESLDLTKATPSVVYGFLKHHWEMGERDIAVRYLRQYSRYLAQQLDRRMGLASQHGVVTSEFEAAELEEQTRLLARCHFKLGEWQKFLTLERGEEVGSSIIESYLAATSYDKNWYKAWHGWALVNFEMATMQERRHSASASKKATAPHVSRPSTTKLNPYLVPAIQGFFRSIGLSDGSSLQDSLRLLTLWFKYGSLAEVNAVVGDGFHSVPVDNWLQVIPQLIARIHVPSPQVRRLIHHLLSDIGKQHPQALIYPLTVASKSQSVSRRTSALALLDKMRSHSTRLVEQAIMVSQELIRVAILWEEMWYEGLEEASKLYFGDQNVPAMLAVLEPLHQLIEKGPETARETAFLEAYGGDLKEARERCLRYNRTGNASDISAAWDLYYQVFRKISKQLPQLGAIDLAMASPKLLEAGDLDIAIPGTYRAGGPVIRIVNFNPTVGVINSKQRPRKLILIGSDGQRYKYLLKGHEDLRQDERVMQLFGLVNTLLSVDSETRKRHLTIERFSVVPLSQNTGLIGWVPHCDTIHSLVRDYREARGVLLSIEHRLMLQFAPDYDHLPVLNKVEAFDWALNNSDGRDLSRIMWQRSLTSELWLERRLAYIRSLAVMSMVGYILGLGDRHPSNLMIEQVSGRVVHIDFGDCFEVAMQREKFPERVPFRLTRMLVRAMEVSGLEGSFRITAEHSMRVLRLNKDSLMAVLEAFVYDPLINWRLLARPESKKPSSSITMSSGSVAGLSSGASLAGEISASSAVNFPENFSSSRRVRRDAEISRLEDESINRPDAVNAGALNVISRVSNKLTGRDFAGAALDVPQQVERLIQEASAIENLCQAYVGWCAFW